MQNLQTLIDKASEVCGGDGKLAARMGVKPNVVSMLRHGRTITPETAAELADIAGDDAREALVMAVLARAKGTRREGVLRDILGKALAAGVAAMSLFFYSADSNYATEATNQGNEKFTLLYIVEYVTRLWRSAAWAFHCRASKAMSLSTI
jgi:hypothetical protein